MPRHSALLNESPATAEMADRGVATAENFPKFNVHRWERPGLGWVDQDPI